MHDVITKLLAQSSMPSGGRVLGDALRLTVLPPRTVIQLRLGAAALKTADSIRIAGRRLPDTMNTWNGEDPVICRIAPDGWLLLSSLHEAAELINATARGCGKRACAITELSDSFVLLALDGPGADAVFARGCGLDLADTSFGRDACARTRLAQLPVIVRRLMHERFECLVDRSAAQYLFDWMQDAAAGLD